VEKVDLCIGEEVPIPPGGDRGFIHGDYFGHWSEMDLVFEIDGFSSVGFLAPFEHTRKEFRAAFRPFSYKPIEVMIGLQTIFKGTQLDVEPDFDSNSKSIKVTANSLPSVLTDCVMPASVFAKGKGLEWKKMSLRTIFEECVEPFGLKVDFRADPGKVFDKVKLEKDKKVFEFLAELTKQRNAVISNTPIGQLLCWQGITSGVPVQSFVEGVAPLGTVKASFSPREYYSEVTGCAARKRGKAPAIWTEKNAWLSTPLRPHTFKLDDTERADAPEATKAFVGRMFGAMASWRIENLPTWRDSKGRLFQPNTLVSVLAPDAMIYRKTDLLIRRVELHQDKDNESAALEVVLPGAFSGVVPTVLPWD
jgi:prophage tail gpP-like protein